MSTTISIQPGQSSEGMGYNVHKPLPYPFHIDADTGYCICGRGTADLAEAPTGRPWRLLGFQRERDVQLVDLLFKDFIADPMHAIGMFPVFADLDGVFNLTEPVTNVTDHRVIRPVETRRAPNPAVTR